MSAGSTSAGSTIPDSSAFSNDPAQQLGTESALSTYVGPYVTDMLGKGQALAELGYQGYGGPLTAGESAAQTKAFEGIAGLDVPTDAMGVFTPKASLMRVSPGSL